MLLSSRVLFEDGTKACGPRGSDPASADAEQKLRLWGSQMDLAEGLETKSLSGI